MESEEPETGHIQETIIVHLSWRRQEAEIQVRPSNIMWPKYLNIDVYYSAKYVSLCFFLVPWLLALRYVNLKHHNIECCCFQSWSFCSTCSWCTCTFVQYIHNRWYTHIPSFLLLSFADSPLEWSWEETSPLTCWKIRQISCRKYLDLLSSHGQGMWLLNLPS